MSTVTFTFNDPHGLSSATVSVQMTDALKLNLIAVARRVDQLVEWDAAAVTFERDMLAVLDGKSARSVDSMLGEMRAWAEDQAHELVWDRDGQYFVVMEEQQLGAES